MRSIVRWATLFLACQTAAGQEPGWTELFDGESLEGWVTVGGRYDGHASWSVEEGVIVGREGPGHQGGLLYTRDAYRNFEFELETFITYPFDSGIFVRMRPEGKGAQFTLDYRPDGEIAGIYSDGYVCHNTTAKAAYRRDEWNHFRVRCVGDPMHLQCWMNGDLVTDYRIPEGSGDFVADGLIGLQVHGSRNDPEGSRVMFRNIRVRELAGNAGEYFTDPGDGFLQLTPEGKAAGWEALFNGRDLTGWEAAGDGTGYRVREGVLEFLTAGNSPYLMTEQDYRDFQLRLDFKITRRANSGVFLRSKRSEDNPSYSGCEVQILDDFHWEEDTGTTLQPYQFTGGLYGAVPPGKKALRPHGEWNTYTITYRGSRIVTVLNGQILYDVDTFELDAEPPFEGRAPAGFLGLQRHGPAGPLESDCYASFRNLFVRGL